MISTPTVAGLTKRNQKFSKATLLLLSFVLILLFRVPATAQSCENVPQGSGENISAWITVDGAGTPLNGEPTVPAGTLVRIDSVAVANGQCQSMGWNCSSSPCVCEPNGYTYLRTVNHTNVTVDITTSGVWNGSYSVGSVHGRNPDGTGTFWQTLDTENANSTGPNYFTLALPGTYTFHVQAIINTTPCNMQPTETQTVTITIQAEEADDARNNGTDSCSSVGRPVNVTNGNMYLQQTDYRLPGIGEGLEITRTYNSRNQRAGLFGYSWSSLLDTSIVTYGNLLLWLNLADGRAVYLARPSTASTTYTPRAPLDFHAQIVRNVDNSYTLSYQDGRVQQFNAGGKLVSFSNRNGNTVSLTYNGSGKPTTITVPGGRTVTLTYDSYGLIGSMSDSLGTIATYTHAFWGRLTSVTYADGSKFNFTDIFVGNNIYLTTVKDVLNNVLESHTYDAQGRAITSEIAGNGTERYTLTFVNATETHVTNALNRVTKYFFDTSKGRNVVTRVEGDCGCGSGSQEQTWTYDNQLNLTATTNALNQTTSYTYDTNGNRLTETNALGTTTFTYNAFGQVLTVTDPMNGVWTNTYDSNGNLLTVKDALNHTATLTYGTQGELLTITDPRNNTTTLTYNTNGDLTRRTDALNNQTNIAYDARGRVTSETNALNQMTSYEYDLAGRLKKVIYPDTNFVLFTYDLAGRRTKIKDPRGYETTFAYDAAYRLTSETNADNKTTSYSYDLMSNLTGVTDALNRTTNYTYDNFNRLTKIKYPEATVGASRLEENFAYDLVGNLITKTDQAGRVTTFCYDNVNRLTSTIDPAQKTTAFEYNARSQMTAVVDAINQRYEFVYDPLGRRTQEKKGAATMTLVYDAVGNRSQRTDYNNATTNYSYDALNRLTTISYPDTTSATYGYDVLSRLTTATNQTGTVTIAYDNRSRASSVTDVFGQVVTYQYDANSNRTQLSLNGATNANYQYDVINRLTQLTDNATLNTTFAYDATNKLTSRTLPNGVVTTSQYDGLDRLTRLTHAKAGNTLADFQYQFNTVNSITQMIDSAGTHNFSYDNLDRLTAATHPNQPNESYTLDDVGNRTASHQGASYSYQPFNRLVTANGTTFGYNTNGNLISKTDASGSWTYSWDFENRLKQASKSGGVTVSYSFDALGRRVQRTSSVSGTEKFIYDGADVVRDLDVNNAIVADYLNGPGIDNRLRQTSSGIASYYLSDHLGTTEDLLDASGSLTANLNYDSFGNVSGGAAPTRYTYAGREIDFETGLMYYRARWYDPVQGRFISEDPVGLEGGINLFAYVENKPTRFRDPSGLCPQNTSGPQITPCDRKFASIFGDSDAVARTAYEYDGRYRGFDPDARAAAAGLPRSEFSNPVWDAEHLYNFPHLSGDLAGTENADIYVPGNYSGQPTGPTRGDAVVTFYYKSFFGLKNVTLAVFHVDNSRVERATDGSIRVGTTGGPGGATPGPKPNLHSHFELWKGRGYRPPGSARDKARIPLSPVICGPTARSHHASDACAQKRRARTRTPNPSAELTKNQENTHQEPRVFHGNINEDAKVGLVGVAADARDGKLIILIAHRGTKESRVISLRRLKTARDYLRYTHAIAPTQIVTAEGDPIRGSGRIDVYIDGRLHSRFSLFKRNRDFAPEP